MWPFRKHDGLSKKGDRKSETQSSIFSPLSGTHAFRLLELLPGTGSAQVQCNLKTADLSLKLLYNAISYTWGTNLTKSDILVNGCKMKIRLAARLMMQELRHPSDSQTLWIDTICIYFYRTLMKSLRNLSLTPRYMRSFMPHN